MRTCPHYNDGTKCPETLQTVKRNEKKINQSPETWAELVTHLVAVASSAEQANKWKIDKRTKNINTKCLSLTKTRDMEARDIVSILLPPLLLLLLEVQLQQILPISIVYVSERTHSKAPFLAHATWCEWSSYIRYGHCWPYKIIFVCFICRVTVVHNVDFSACFLNSISRAHTFSHISSFFLFAFYEMAQPQK